MKESATLTTAILVVSHDSRPSRTDDDVVVNFIALQHIEVRTVPTVLWIGYNYCHFHNNISRHIGQG